MTWFIIWAWLFSLFFETLLLFARSHFMFRYIAKPLNLNYFWSFCFFVLLCLYPVLFKLVFFSLFIFTTISVRTAHFRIIIFMIMLTFWRNWLMFLIRILRLFLLYFIRLYWFSFCSDRKYVSHFGYIIARLFRISIYFPWILVFDLYLLFFFRYFFRLLFGFIIFTALTIRIVLFRFLF